MPKLSPAAVASNELLDENGYATVVIIVIDQNNNLGLSAAISKSKGTSRATEILSKVAKTLIEEVGPTVINTLPI
jgi:hypothetical protein